LERQIGADTISLQEVSEIRFGAGARIMFEGDTFVDAPGDYILLDSLEFGAGQPFARFEVARKEQLVTRDCHPIDALELSIDTDPGTVLGVVERCRHISTAPQPRERGVIVFAGALEIHYRVAGDPARANQFGAELAPGAELDVIRKQFFVRRVGTLLDDDVIPSSSHPPSTIASTTTAKANNRRTTVPSVRRSDQLIIYYA
jgi:hypothetical protein